MRQQFIALSLACLITFPGAGLADGHGEGDERKFNGVLGTTFASDYFTKPGFVPGRGPVNQTLLYSAYAITPHSGVSGLFWTDYDFSDKAFHEVDLGVYFKTRTSIGGDFLHGQLEVRFGYEIFTYPSKLISASADHLLRGGLHYSGVIDVDAELTQLLTSGGGEMVALTASKSIPVLRRDNLVLAVSPSLKVTVVNDFFGVDGVTKVSPGMSIDLSVARLTYFLGAEMQNGRHGMEDITQYFGGMIVHF